MKHIVSPLERSNKQPQGEAKWREAVSLQVSDDQ
jgi:hypothetical protein